jgi:hypothetical protein
MPAVALWLVGAILSAALGGYFITQGPDLQTTSNQDSVIAEGTSPHVQSIEPVPQATSTLATPPKSSDNHAPPENTFTKPTTPIKKVVGATQAVPPPVVAQEPPTIVPLPPPGVPPPAGPEITAIIGPSIVKFADENTWEVVIAHPDGPRQNYIYYADWGDGKDFAIFDIYNIPSSVNKLTHTYVTVGTYTAIFKARGPNGVETIRTFEVQVEPADPKAPLIKSITPTEGLIGTTITLVGTGFTPTGNIIHFGNGFLPPHDAVDGKIIFTLPLLLHTYCPPDEGCFQQVGTPGEFKYHLLVKNANGVSPTVQFTVKGFERFR